MSILAGLSFSGGFLGGEVSTFQPTFEFKYFHPLKFISKDPEKPDVFGMRVLAGHIRAFGTPIDVNSLSFVNGTPIFSRYFLGGEDTIRGYNVRSISPVARVDQYVTTQNVYATNVSGETLLVRKPKNADRRTITPASSTGSRSIRSS